MKSYKYRSKNPQGKLVTGVLDAESENEAISELRRRGLTIISLNTQRSSANKGKSSFFSMEIGGGKGGANRKRKVKSADIVIITRQLATMVSAGIPLVEGLEILGEQASNPTLRLTLADVVSDVRAGKDFSQALIQHPKVFNNIYINMVRAGEASGQLDVVLARLAEYQEDAEKLKAEIKSAMTYPVISLIMITGITLFLLVFIIPKFEEMFKSMNVELPGITKALLATSQFLQEYFLYWTGGIVAVIVSVIMYFRTEKGSFVRDWIIL